MERGNNKMRRNRTRRVLVADKNTSKKQIKEERKPVPLRRRRRGPIKKTKEKESFSDSSVEEIESDKNYLANKLDEISKQNEIDAFEELEIGNDMKVKDNFDLHNRKLMLTYKTHINKDNYKAWLNGYYKSKKGHEDMKIYMAHESGDKSHNYLHTHVLIDFVKAVRIRSAKRLDYMGIHPHIKKIITPTHWLNALNYLSKEDPENKHLSKNKPSELVQEVWNADDVTDAILKCVVKPCDVFGVRELYSMKPPDYSDNKEILENNRLTRVFFKVTSLYKPNDRTINYIYNPNGGIGKTRIMNYMSLNHPKDWVTIINYKSLNDTMHLLSRKIANGWSGRGVIINVTKKAGLTMEKNPDTYDLTDLIENLLDRRIQSVKYNGCDIILKESPCLWVFSNFLPHIGETAIDRWRILKAESKKKVYLLRLMNNRSPLKYITTDIPSHGVIDHTYVPPSKSSSSESADSISFSVI